MKNRVGDGSDIDNIILLGGGSTLFARTIKAFYPKHTPLVIENAQMANVMGFQAAGFSSQRATLRCGFSVARILIGAIQWLSARVMM